MTSSLEFSFILHENQFLTLTNLSDKGSSADVHIAKLTLPTFGCVMLAAES